MNKLERNSLQFDYFSSNYHQFERDFYQYANIDTPLTFITDDILNLMTSTNKNYFKLNALHAKDKKSHYFFFRQKLQPDNQAVKCFVYLGHRV